jgi:hypothetical protein
MPRLAADRVGLLILLLATVAGLWLGLAGSDTSPVAPLGSPPVQVLDALGSFLANGPDGGFGR